VAWAIQPGQFVSVSDWLWEDFNGATYKAWKKPATAIVLHVHEKTDELTLCPITSKNAQGMHSLDKVAERAYKYYVLVSSFQYDVESQFQFPLVHRQLVCVKDLTLDPSFAKLNSVKVVNVKHVKIVPNALAVGEVTDLITMYKQVILGERKIEITASDVPKKDDKPKDQTGGGAGAGSGSSSSSSSSSSAPTGSAAGGGNANATTAKDNEKTKKSSTSENDIFISDAVLNLSPELLLIVGMVHCYGANHRGRKGVWIPGAVIDAVPELQEAIGTIEQPSQSEAHDGPSHALDHHEFLEVIRTLAALTPEKGSKDKEKEKEEKPAGLSTEDREAIATRLFQLYHSSYSPKQIEGDVSGLRTPIFVESQQPERQYAGT